FVDDGAKESARSRPNGESSRPSFRTSMLGNIRSGYSRWWSKYCSIQFAIRSCGEMGGHAARPQTRRPTDHDGLYAEATGIWHRWSQADREALYACDVASRVWRLW